MKSLRRAPFLTFAIVGGLLHSVLAPYLPWGRETIRVDAGTVAGIVERETNLKGRELTGDERDGAIEQHVREEILVREAYHHGWYLENGRVRQRLSLAMRTALREDVPQASTAQLRAYYQANAERYRIPESVTISHVFFEDEPPENVLSALERGAEFRGMGDRSSLGSTMVRQTVHQLRGALGAPFAEAVFALEPGVWSGPLASNRGTHFVRVDARHPPRLPDFDTVQRFVRVDWESERRLAIRERKMSRIRERYTVIER